MAHKLITDLDYNTIVASGRKSVTLKASDPAFLLRRVVRSPFERIIKEGLLYNSDPPLSPTEYQHLHDKKWLVTENLASWPPQHPILKFSISRYTNVYILTAIDVRSTDSYFLKTHEWPQVRRALHNLTSGAVDLESAALLDVYNPFALYAPFGTAPSQDDFKAVNNEIVLAIEEGLRKMETSKYAGFMWGKVAGEYYKAIADLQRLELVVGMLSTPSTDYFENGDLEI